MVTVHAEITAPDSGGHRRLVLMAAGGSDAEIAHAAKYLQTLTPLFKPSEPPGALITAATWPTVVQLSATFGPMLAPGPDLRAWIAEQAAARTTVPQPTYRPPKGMIPRPYQLEGAAMIAATGRTLIFDQPRTGKTITAILGVLERAAATMNPGPVIVVCPASVVDSWVEAWEIWAPHVDVVAWRGPKRKSLLGTADVYVTSYNTATSDAPPVRMVAPLRHLKASALVIDETHFIKNPQSARSQAVVRIARWVTKEHAERATVVGLSGTPITHHPGNLCPILECLEPEAWPSGERMVNRYCHRVQGDYDVEILGLNPHTEPEFRLTLLGQHRRVARADVMADLPPKVYSVRTVDLPSEWRKAYDDFEQKMLAELPPVDGKGGGELSVMDVKSVFTHLSGLSASPADVEVTYGPDVDERTGEPKRHVHLELKGPSWKVAALLEILDERCGPVVGGGAGDRVVAFAPSRQLMKLAGAAAQKAGYRVGYVVGGQSAKDRTAAIKAFQAGDLDLVCATTGAGGTGITLSTAGTLVFLQRPWALVDSIQAEDRGEGDLEATRGTEIIDVVARSTIDTRVRAVLRARAGQLADLVQDPRIVAELLGGSSVMRAAS